jgi:ribonuclease BN (tRNA processing enzyme)
MSLTLVVLGSSGTYAGPDNPNSGYFVTDGTTRVWLDCGPGTLGPLQQHVALADLDAVVVTHGHPDHCLDAAVLRNALRYGIGRKGVPVYGPFAAQERIVAALGEDVTPTLDWRDIRDGSTFTTGGISWTCSRTDHPVTTMAVRIDAGGVIAYSADTGPGWSFERFGPPIDLALCEASLPPDREGSVQHLTGRQAGEKARQAGARRLVITHLPPGTDIEARQREAEAGFGGPVEVAVPGARFTVG